MDITDSVTSIATDIGVRNPEDFLSFDGKLTITVNKDKIDIVNLYKKGVRVNVQLMDKRNGRLWGIYVGFTDKLIDNIGVRNKEATIECLQGIKELKTKIVEPFIVFNQRIDEVIKRILDNKDVRIPLTLDTSTNFGRSGRTLLSIARTRRASGNIQNINLDRGIFTYQMIGDRWNDNTTVDTALEDLLQAEAARLWVARNGFYVFQNARRFINYGYQFKTIELKNIIKHKYEYDTLLVRDIDIEWYPKILDQNDSQELWSLDYRYRLEAKNISEPIKMVINKEDIIFNNLLTGLSDADIDLKLYRASLSDDVPFTNNLFQEYIDALRQYEIDYKEYKVRIARYNDIVNEQSVSQSIIDGILMREFPDGEPVEPTEVPPFEPYLEEQDYIRDRVKYTIYTVNGYWYISFYNDNTIPIYVSLSGITGFTYKNAKPSIFSYNTKDIPNTNKLNIDSPIISKEIEGQTLANYYRLQNLVEGGWLEQITLQATDEEQLADIHDITLASYLEIDGSYYMVIGERLKFNRTVLTATYTLMRLPNIDFLSYDNTLLPTQVGI